MNKLLFSCVLLGLLKVGFVQLSAQTLALEVKNDSIIYNYDDRGNRLLDYSYCGYRSSEQKIPDVHNAVYVPHRPGDNSDRIQHAIDYVSSLPADKNGFRGAILLGEGTFDLNKELVISTSGIVLRGSGKNNTTLVKHGVDRGALLRIEGVDNRNMIHTPSVISGYVPVNSKEIEISSVTSLKAGDRVIIKRPSTKEWIESIGCEVFGGGISALGWKPGDADIYWDRTITDVVNNKVILDAPLTMALDAGYGQSELLVYQWRGRIENCGVEDITFISDYDSEYPKDEDHCWTGISMEHAENCWVRRINFKQFAGSAVILQPTASKVTVEDCISLSPVSEIGGMRRNTFLTLGQQTLFQRCYSEHGIHDFAVGYCAAGPNAFVQCESKESLGFSGPLDIWAPGILFDVVNIDGHNLIYKNLGQNKNGAGWNTGNSMFWQCTASEIECYSPSKDAMNRAYGCWAQFSGDGEWAQSNSHVRPRSLFYAQLEERLQKGCSESARILPMNTNATSSPTVEEAMILAKEAYIPRLTLEKWINDSPVTTSFDYSNLKSIDEIKYKFPINKPVRKNEISIKDGRLQSNGYLLAGPKIEVSWWSGKLRAPAIAKSNPHLTRFVPGREGTGLTDRVDSVISYMKKGKVLALDHNYGLWYERRRDDHERVRRRDGDVWGPFYEQPFARSGQGTAWDGLSKYDLNRPNAWYWSRLKQFADKAEQENMLLYHQNYFQHNILEAGAHWVDSPWRSVNNINHTGFPEPVPFAGDKRIFVADMFYDINHPVRREYHKKYIRKCLDNFADNSNVVQLISAEFTGPLHFVQFWLDEIAAWEKETGKSALVALSTTKDVQDAILNDPERSAIVDIIDIRYWHYKSDGTLYAPEGGRNLAPRQHARKMKAGKVTFKEAYKAVSEYRTKYPDKAVTYYTQNYPDMGWASFMAGGSCPVINVQDDQLLKDILQMQPENTPTDDYRKMVKSGIGSIIYSHSSGNIPLELSPGKYILKYIDPKTGKIETLNSSLVVKSKQEIKLPVDKPGVYWIRKK